jgi:hypothetical protein
LTEPRKENLAVLFADITRSVDLYQAHGDEKAYQIVVQSIEMLVEHTQNFGGTVVKTIGDEIMAFFPSVDQAAKAAIEMQQSMINSPTGIKVGFHAGPVIFSDSGDDIFGDAVNIAARVVGKAESGQIVTLAEDVERLSSSLRPNARKVRTDWIKGVEDTVTFFEFVWWDEDSESMTIVDVGTETFDMAAAGGSSTMTITFEDQVFEMGANLKSLTIGRNKSNDLIVDEQYVSKEHAKIAFSQNKFTLKDSSSNGTFVVPDDGEGNRIRLRKWDLKELTGGGIIALGKNPDEGCDWLIQYNVNKE